MNSSTTVHEWLKQATRRLVANGIPSARLDALVLLEDALKADRAVVLAEPERVLSEPQRAVLDKQLLRRSKQEPLAYIRGHVEFYKHYFLVNKHVLIPRPESETMIELLGHLPAVKSVADIGTGSGALGISASLEYGLQDVGLYDISLTALSVARHNAQLYRLNLRIERSNLLSQVQRHYDVAVANLPYVPNDYQVSPGALYEPALALFAGNDGMAIYRKFWKQLETISQVRPRFVITECLPVQQAAQTDCALTATYRLVRTSGLTQIFETKR